MNKRDVQRAFDRAAASYDAAAVLQHDPEALLVHANSPVKTLADLNGRSVIAPPSMTWIPYVKAKYGIKFDLRPLNYGLTSFLADPTAIQQCILTSEPYFAEQHGVKVVDRVPARIQHQAENERYLATKALKLGHQIDWLG